MGPVPKISVALSGGGHRAALFSAGALLALTDAGVNQQVDVLASVSGGSITNGLVARSGDFGAHETTTTDLQDWLMPGLAVFHKTGLFFPGEPTNRFVRGVFFLFGLTIASLLTLLTLVCSIGRHASWKDGWHVAVIELAVMLIVVVVVWAIKRKKLKLRLVWPLALGLLGILACAPAVKYAWSHGRSVRDSVLAGVAAVLFVTLATRLAVWRFGQRGRKVDDALDAGLCDHAFLTAVDRSVHHVFCTTNLASGTQAYLSPRVVSCYRLGTGTPKSTLRLSTAMQVSSAFPGGFNARRLTSADLFAGAANDAVADLVDGGVYDNMGDQWELGWEDRRKRLAEEDPPIYLEGFNTQPSGALVVVNAGGSYQPGAITARGIRREIAALLKDKSVMYDQTTAVKRRYLYQLFVDGHPLRGALVQITQSPYDVPSDLAPAPNESEPDDMQLRAKAALAFLDRVEIPVSQADTRRNAWNSVRDCSHGVPTVLSPLDLNTCTNLMLHGYVLTRINLCVLLALGTLSDPSNDSEMTKWTAGRFEALVTSSVA